MKNKYVILIISIILSSCGNDEDSNNFNTIESLVGEWKISQRIVDGNLDTIGECEPFNVYTYNENGTYSVLLYEAVRNSDCLNNNSIEFTGTWQKENENEYSFTNSNNTTSKFLIEFLSNDSFNKTSYSFSDPNDTRLVTVIEKYERIN